MIDPLIMYPGYLLRRASAIAMADVAKQLKTLRLSPTEATVLNVIDANPNANQSDIGRLLDIASANMAPLVSRLVERDLIERRPVDKRSHGLVLSSSGRKLTEKIKRIFAAYEAKLLARIPAAQQEVFMSVMRALAKPDSR
jgi:DNA-binding MarR family transcriptional regulator